MRIWEFFENLNELVYVSDMDTHKVVYMNKKTLEVFGYKKLEDVVGRKCYEVVQNSLTPCSICNNSTLKAGEFQEWNYYNPVLKRHFMLKDTMVEEEGRRYRIEMAIDVTTQEKQRDTIHHFEDMETMVNEGIRIALQAKTPDKSIDVILEYLGKALHGERTYIFEKKPDGCDDNTYEWVANGVTPEKDNLQNVPPEACENWYRSFKDNDSVVIEDIENIKDINPLQYEILDAQNIKSVVVVPLIDDKKVIGFYGVDNPPAQYLEYTSNMLQIMGYFIISSLRRRNLLRQLQNMSYTDQLTGVGNRHAMHEAIVELPIGKPLSVVYCDITGLKQVNDLEGHEAGDRLILKASGCLKKVFSSSDIFRIGGDEFLVFDQNMKQESLDLSIQDLRTEAAKEDVVIAIGSVFRTDGTSYVDDLMVEAEQRMYKDKLAYYERLGIEVRKY